MKLKDRVAIITGGASGIGAASARLFAEEGAKVALIDQDGEGLANVAAGLDAITITADVSNDKRARDGVARVMSLASDDSSFVTGTLLFVDGGWTAHWPCHAS